MARPLVLLLALGLALAAAAPAAAAPGPCRPDAAGRVTCGDGAGAARLIDHTTSPSGRLALAWRSRDQAPDEEPDPDTVELLLVRRADGAILAHGPGAYWDTGTAHANRISLAAAWSSDSRMVVAVTDGRFGTEQLRVHAIAAGDAVHSLELKPALEAAVRRRLQALARNESAHAFGIAVRDDGAPALTIDDNGHLVATVLMAVPKTDESLRFAVTARITGRGDALGVTDIAVRRMVEPRQ